MQCLNKLQYFKLNSSTLMNAALPLLRTDTVITFQDRYSLFFNDYSLTPLIIEENYVNSIASRHYDNSKVFNVLAESADALCNMESVNNRIMQTNVFYF